MTEDVRWFCQVESWHKVRAAQSIQSGLLWWEFIEPTGLSLSLSLLFWSVCAGLTSLVSAPFLFFCRPKRGFPIPHILLLYDKLPLPPVLTDHLKYCWLGFNLLSLGHQGFSLQVSKLAFLCYIQFNLSINRKLKSAVAEWPVLHIFRLKNQKPV